MARGNLEKRPAMSLSHYLWIQREWWWRDMPFRQGIKKKKNHKTLLRVDIKCF